MSISMQRGDGLSQLLGDTVEGISNKGRDPSGNTLNGLRENEIALDRNMVTVSKDFAQKGSLMSASLAFAGIETGNINTFGEDGPKSPKPQMAPAPQ